MSDLQVFTGEYFLKHDSSTDVKNHNNVLAKTKSKRQSNPKTDCISPFISLESWVNTKVSKECFMFFKPQNTKSVNYPAIEVDKYFLLLMTKSQEFFLKNFSQKLVCIDQQYGENFKLLTLLVLDDKQQCLPCAYLLTNEMTAEIAKIFFTEIRSVVGYLKTNLVLSDNDVISRAWDEVMVQCDKHMICSWEIITDWEFNLSQIVDSKKQATFINELERAISEKDVNGFTNLFQLLLDRLESDVETEEFFRYVHAKYSNSPQTWASCYRFEDESALGYLEMNKVHKALEFILKSKPTKSINKALVAVLDFFRRKIYDRLLVRSGGKVSSKMYEIKEKHRTTEQMTYQITKNCDYWSVVSGKKEENIVKISYTDCPCQLKCHICRVCAHAFTCSCPDSMLRLNICRHIHSVCMYEAKFIDSVIPAQDVSENPGTSIVSNSKSIIEITVDNDKVNQTLPFKTKSLKNKTTCLPKVLCKSTMHNTKRNIGHTSMVEKAQETMLTAKHYGEKLNQSKSIQLKEPQSTKHQKLSENIDLKKNLLQHSVYQHQNESLEGEPRNSDLEDIQVLLAQEVPTTLTPRINTSIEYRKNKIEHIFKSILSCVENEDQMTALENAVTSLQCISRKPSAKKDGDLLVSKAKNQEQIISSNQPSFDQPPLKVLKICDLSGNAVQMGQPAIGKPVLLKFV